MIILIIIAAGVAAVAAPKAGVAAAQNGKYYVKTFKIIFKTLLKTKLLVLKALGVFSI